MKMWSVTLESQLKLVNEKLTQGLASNKIYNFRYQIILYAMAIKFFCTVIDWLAFCRSSSSSERDNPSMALFSPPSTFSLPPL